MSHGMIHVRTRGASPSGVRAGLEFKIETASAQDTRRYESSKSTLTGVRWKDKDHGSVGRSKMGVRSKAASDEADGNGQDLWHRLLRPLPAQHPNGRDNSVETTPHTVQGHLAHQKNTGALDDMIGRNNSKTGAYHMVNIASLRPHTLMEDTLPRRSFRVFIRSAKSTIRNPSQTTAEMAQFTQTHIIQGEVVYARAFSIHVDLRRSRGTATDK
ncbi:hypothetical protein BJ322DRAFT_1023556 [Thelephora terrestris]|uniref:Uncharacterized protein n=1 Tax=Thelephora terrestris TaxID=56493 RepID=A0A9P6H7N9_9AGAM|nr:hypothetical protein BJ322DRAFT_1023556 [Thelephora terrestris]